MLATRIFHAPCKRHVSRGACTLCLQEGYREYAAALAASLPRETQPRVAPVGTAFSAVRDLRPEMWHELFHTDGFHPSPLGSYLEALVIYSVIFGSLPPTASSVPDKPAQLWAHARLMQPAGACTCSAYTVRTRRVCSAFAGSAARVMRCVSGALAPCRRATQPAAHCRGDALPPWRRGARLCGAGGRRAGAGCEEATFLSAWFVTSRTAQRFYPRSSLPDFCISIPVLHVGAYEFTAFIKKNAGAVLGPYRTVL